MNLQTEDRPIGGYFGLEIETRHRLPHPNAVPVNFGRGGLELIIQVRGYEVVWIPDYICPSVPLFLTNLGVACKTYPVDEKFEPIRMPRRKKNEAFLYVNYFGIKDKYCRILERTCTNLILDLTQAFYYIPQLTDSFNSVRKFFGVPDGGFVYLNDRCQKNNINANLKQSFSYNCCAPLLKRTDGDLAGGYRDFQALSAYWRNLHVAKMSNLSMQILMSIDLKNASKRRRKNYSYLHSKLSQNSNAKQAQLGVPLVYPYRTCLNGQALRDYLIGNKVFCPSYWPGVSDQTKLNIRYSDIVFLPIDHRYGDDEMDRIVNLVKEFEER